jgi:hypothetical protein
VTVSTGRCRPEADFDGPKFKSDSLAVPAPLSHLTGSRIGMPSELRSGAFARFLVPPQLNGNAAERYRGASRYFWYLTAGHIVKLALITMDVFMTRTDRVS